MNVGALLSFCLVNHAAADLRMASQPKGSPPYQLTNQGNVPWKLQPWKGQMHFKYMEPSTFNYKGLINQKNRNYDNFLRSNIDNEQDNRNFNDEEGKDHLPFRTDESATFDTYYKAYGNTFGIKQVPREIPLGKEVKAGETVLVPFRWNNPHASEMEVNIWIHDHAEKDKPIVVPIRKPSCSGEGYQDNVISFTVPKDFTSLGEKIPGFKGCNKDSKPQCTLQIYSHSVESRTYASGFPIIIPGHKPGVAAKSVAIEEMTQDPWLDLTGLRELCLPATDPTANIASAKPRWARQVSDVFNHAYQNSDYSPYSGQQHESISRNMQASAVNKMEVGNRGELGKSILTTEAYNRLRYLRGLENKIYKSYEALANKIIQRYGNNMKSTASVGIASAGVQQLANCFRCSEAGSTNTNRLQTNTYIPSFQLPQNMVQNARNLVPSKYSSLITSSGVVQIYVASMKDLLPFFFESRNLGLIYQDAAVKKTGATMADAGKFKKRNANNQVDGGKFSALEAKKSFVAERGCPKECLDVKQPGTSLLEQADAGADKGQDEAAKVSPFSVPSTMKMATITRPVTVKYDLGKNMWLVGCVDGRYLRMVQIEIKSETEYRWIATRYRYIRYTADRRCANQATFVKECFTGSDPGRDAYLVIPPFVKNTAAGQTPNPRSGGPIMKNTNKVWFCVANVNKKSVSGPYYELSKAKEALAKLGTGSRSNRQMVCEMTRNGAKSDPHWVGGQHQGAGRNAGFEKYWLNSNDYRGMNNQCAADIGCKYKIPLGTIEKPLAKGLLATNVTGPCYKCVQFFGKVIRPLQEPPVSRLANDVIKHPGRVASAGVPMLRRNDDDTFPGVKTDTLLQTGGAARRRRRGAAMLQEGHKQRRNKKSKRSRLERVGAFLNQVEHEQNYNLGLEVFDDVDPLPVPDRSKTWE